MLTRWSPFNTTRPYTGLSLLNDFDGLFRDLTAPAASGRPPHGLILAADVFDAPDAVVVRVDLPGHDPEKMSVQLEGRILHITSERKEEPAAEGRYLRKGRSNEKLDLTIEVPRNVDGSNPEARFDGGVLTITLPKKEESKPKSIEVKVQTP